MLSFYVINLLIPGDPEKLDLNLPSGTWTLERHPDYVKFKQAIANGQCAETYFLEHQGTMASGAHTVDQAFDEVTPVLLAASYLTGQSVTIKRSTPQSEISIVQPSEHWPRERSMDTMSAVVRSDSEFRDQVERFVLSWSQAGQFEKARLLVHHWLDGLACWSMEDLYLSATTLLQVIVATEAARQGKKDMPYYQGVMDAASNMHIRTLSDDFKNMRNELIHDGQLVGKRFSGPDKAACSVVVADVLNWFDEYLHAALVLGSPKRTRFSKTDFIGLNAYSLN